MTNAKDTFLFAAFRVPTFDRASSALYLDGVRSSGDSFPMSSRFIAALAAGLSSGFGSGYSRVVPGTCGSAAALVVWWIVASLGWLSTPTSQIVLIVFSIIVGTVVVGVCLRGEASSDPQWIVIDEWAGMFISLFGVQPSQWTLMLVAFVAFRIFDGSKVGPVGWSERLPGQYGIMADDVVAGVLSALVVSLVKSTGVL